MAREGVTKAQLARDLGIARSSVVRKIRTDHFTPREVRRICEILDLQDPYLITTLFIWPSPDQPMNEKG